MKTKESLNYKIEKNIPIKRYKTGGIWQDLAEKMEVGDSVLFESRIKATCLAASLRGLHGVMGTIRKQKDGQFRIWRKAKGKK